MVKNHSPNAKNSQPRSQSRPQLSPSKSDLRASDSLSTPSPSKARIRRAKMAAAKNGALPTGVDSSLDISVSESNGDLPGQSSVKKGGSRPRLYSSVSDRRLRLEAEDEERKKINLIRSPIKCVYYFLMECLCLVRDYGARFFRSNLILPFAVTVALLVLAYSIHGPHQLYISYVERKGLTCLYWIGLGVLSSIGLGTGLHTFILYLGPHIASVTLAAYECGTLKFPEPPYPDEILCPEGVAEDEDFVPSLWNIMSKVRLESFMWGLGTAIGELPPYFMARAARLSGQEPEELLEVQALMEDKKDNIRLTITERAKIFMEELVAKVGFFGILLGASIPNPLFDLAGITCGHFLVPFTTFFGATLIGKAVIKMHIQMIFVIITFSERHVEHIVRLLTHIPRVGPYLEQPFVEFLQKQKENLHRQDSGAAKHTGQSWLQWGFEKLIIVMVVYFVVSIVNSLAQNYHRRINSSNHKGK